ncbi:MAG: NAD-dependent epimerase/dehydratase family protein [Planctomycetaceae bacterium]|nr:NAD-dependent epimerase/dehydratase family protein [Planctomycetaceae bacterium]
MNIFVTGGTGLLGNTILRQLSAEGESLLSLVRTEPKAGVFEGIKTDFVRGDLGDVDAIEKAVQWADVVIHSAGLIHLGWRRREESFRVNRDGTATVVDACLKHQRKLVHIGAVNCLALGSIDQIASETTPLDHAGGQVPCSYVDSKRAGLTEVRRGVSEGLNAILMHPGFMLGPWDWKPSSGRMMVEVARSWKPLAPSGGCSLCDSRDVATTVVHSLRMDVESGREYILAGHNLTYLDLWQRMAEHMEARKPVMKAGPIQLMLAAGAGELWSGLTSRFGIQEPDINSAAVRMSRQIHWYDSSRAQAELGYQFRDAEVTLSDAANWLRGNSSTSSEG